MRLSFKTLSRNFGKLVSSGAETVKKIGQVVKPAVEILNYTSMFLNSPPGQLMLYGTGALFGPAGFVAANAISTVAKAALISSSLALGAEGVYTGTRDMYEASKTNDYWNMFKGSAKLAMGVGSAATSVGRMGKIIQKGAKKGLNLKAEKMFEKFADEKTRLAVQADQRYVALTNNPSRYALSTQLKNRIGWNTPRPLGGRMDGLVPAPRAAIDAARRAYPDAPHIHTRFINKGRSISIKPIKFRDTRPPRQEVYEV